MPPSLTVCRSVFINTLRASYTSELYVFQTFLSLLSLWPYSARTIVNESNAETEIEAAHDEQYLALKAASVQS